MVGFKFLKMSGNKMYIYLANIKNLFKALINSLQHNINFEIQAPFIIQVLSNFALDLVPLAARFYCPWVYLDFKKWEDWIIPKEKPSLRRVQQKVKKIYCHCLKKYQKSQIITETISSKKQHSLIVNNCTLICILIN